MLFQSKLCIFTVILCTLVHRFSKLLLSAVFIQKVSEYDQEIPQSHAAVQTNPRHREEELQNINSNKTSVK